MRLAQLHVSNSKQTNDALQEVKNKRLDSVLVKYVGERPSWPIQSSKKEEHERPRREGNKIKFIDKQ